MRPGDVATREDREHAGPCKGRADRDRRDPRMGMRRAEHDGMRRHLHPPIVGELPGAAHKSVGRLSHAAPPAGEFKLHGAGSYSAARRRWAAS
jgi:hypothetical protein